MSYSFKVHSELHGSSIELSNRTCGAAGLNHWNGEALFADGSTKQAAFARKADFAGTLAKQAARGEPCVLVLSKLEGHSSEFQFREAFVLGPRGGAKSVVIEPKGASAMEKLDFQHAVEQARKGLAPVRLVLASPGPEMKSGPIAACQIALFDHGKEPAKHQKRDVER
jgi:hypothetical protein